MKMKATIKVALVLAAAMAFLPTTLTAAKEKASAKEKAEAKEQAPAKENAEAKDKAPAKDKAEAKEKAPAKDKAEAKEKEPAKEKAPAKAPEAKPEKAKEPPLPEKPDEATVAKALKAKKPMYTKLAEAKEVAWNCQQPLLVALLAGDDEKSKLLEAKALRKKEFAKDFVSANCVLLVWRLKPAKPEVPQGQGRARRRGPPPKPTAIETRPLKPHEVEFLTKFAVSSTAIANAKRRGDAEPKFSAISCYPTVFCLDPSCRKLFFRDPKYDASVGSPNAAFGAWFSQLVDLFGKTGKEPVLSPTAAKIVEHPTEPKKWK